MIAIGMPSRVPNVPGKKGMAPMPKPQAIKCNGLVHSVVGGGGRFFWYFDRFNMVAISMPVVPIPYTIVLVDTTDDSHHSSFHTSDLPSQRCVPMQIKR